MSVNEVYINHDKNQPINSFTLNIWPIRIHATVKTDCIVCFLLVDQTLVHQLYAFLNIFIQGDVCTVSFQSWGIQGHCQVIKQRSGWGIMARWRPSAEQTAAIPPISRGYIIIYIDLLRAPITLFIFNVTNIPSKRW